MNTIDPVWGFCYGVQIRLQQLGIASTVDAYWAELVFKFDASNRGS